MNKIKERLKDSRETIKWQNVHIYGGSRRRREREKGTKSLYEDVMTENSYLRKEMNLPKLEAQKTTTRMYLKRPTPR